MTSDRGGLPEVVTDGENGFLHDPDDVEGMAGSVLRILADPALAARLGATGRERACREFCIRCVIEDYLAVYERVIAAALR